MHTDRILIPDGYRIAEETETVDIFLARQWLTTKRQHRYTSAVRNGDLVTLKKHTVICPHCEKRIGAYARFANPCFETLYPTPRRLSSDTVDAWASPQYSFFPQEWDTLILNSVYSPDGKDFLCPHCGKHSRPFRSNLQVTVSSRKGKITLSCQTCSLGDLLWMKWGFRKAVCPAFPLEERVVFNTKTGKCWISMHSADGTQIAVRNIYDPKDWMGSILFQLLEENRRVRKITARHFRYSWPGEFPFGTGEMTPVLSVLLSRFRGFSRDFYFRTPFGRGSHFAARSFRQTARSMHTPEGFQKLLQNASLPQVKSVRRLFFEHPEYGFYISELEFLYGCLRNTDLFVQLFGQSFTFELLAFLHQYPYSPESDSGPGAFFRDYASVRSPHSLLTKLSCRIGELRIYAVHYGCLPPAARKQEQRSWFGEEIRCCPAFTHSVPTRSSRIPDIAVDKYSFELLKNLDEYHKAGRELHNCLTEWETCENPVFAVRKSGHCVAAIEVRNDTTIVQAYAAHNVPLILRPAIHAAYMKWMERFHLSESEEEGSEVRTEPSMILSYLQTAVF